LITHSRFDPEKCSAAWMCGSATVTMVKSSTTMSWAVAMTASARPGRLSAGAAGAGLFLRRQPLCPVSQLTR
jgi:hypothetical protein